MLLLMLVILGFSLVAFWVDRDNREEMHALRITVGILVTIMFVILAPWEIKLIGLLWALNLERLYGFKNN